MAKGLITNTYLENIANAIRYKTGSVSNYYPSDMANAINNISGSANLGEINISVNGVYDAINSGLDGFNSVNVHVPMPSYISGILNANANGIYNADDFGYNGFNVVNVSVSGGGGANLGNHTFNTNGIFNANSFGLDGFNQVTIEVPSGGGGADLTNFITELDSNGNALGVSNFAFRITNNQFNSPVRIGGGVTSCEMLFNNCTKLDSPVYIENGVEDCTYMFNGCYNFNQPIILPNSIKSTNGMFYYCSNFNQDVVIPEGVEYCRDMFYSCSNMSGSVMIPNSSIVCDSILYGCYNASEVYIRNVQTTDYVCMFDTYTREYASNNVTIYTDSASLDILKNSYLCGWDSLLTFDSSNYNSQYKIQLLVGSKAIYSATDGTYNPNFIEQRGSTLYKKNSFSYPVTAQSVDNGSLGNSAAINLSVYNNIYSIDGVSVNG